MYTKYNYGGKGRPSYLRIIGFAHDKIKCSDAAYRGLLYYDFKCDMNHVLTKNTIDNNIEAENITEYDWYFIKKKDRQYIAFLMDGEIYFMRLGEIFPDGWMLKDNTNLKIAHRLKMAGHKMHEIVHFLIL